MSINDAVQKIKSFAEGGKGKAVYMILIIVLVGGSSFGLGRLSKDKENADPVRIIYPGQELEANVLQSGSISPQKASTGASKSATKAYVASRKGKKYYPVNCSAASSLKEDNKVFFSTEAEAQAAGYTKSSSC